MQLFNEGLQPSTLNSFRSAITFFTRDSPPLSQDGSIQRLFKFFYKEKPLRPRYTTFWPVSKLLGFLSSMPPMEKLPLKLLTIKYLALMALSSSDRAQSLHLTNIKDMEISPEEIKFIIRSRTKSTRKFLKPTFVTCSSSSDASVDVAKHVAFYIEATKELRGEASQLFISWKTYKPVVRSTMARWLKLALDMAGIDTSIFKGHSYRGAGLSDAYAKGASLQAILGQGNWKNVETFHNHYNAPNYDSNIGRLILGGLDF